MAKKTKTKKSASAKPAVHRDLKNMDIHINEFGEIVRNYAVEDINTFLDGKVKDKKLKTDE